MATLTGSYATSTSQPKKLHAGIVSVYATYTAAAAFSAGDVIQMVKVPNNARIRSLSVADHSVASGTFSVGDGGKTDRYIASTSATLSTVFSLNMAGGLGYKYSFSDDAAVQYDTIDIVIGAAGGSSGSVIALNVSYTTDE